MRFWTLCAAALALSVVFLTAGCKGGSTVVDEDATQKAIQSAPKAGMPGSPGAPESKGAPTSGETKKLGSGPVGG